MHTEDSTQMAPQRWKNVLGRYTVEKILGEGYFGRVFLAKDTVLRRPVAIKELKEQWLTDDAVLKRFADDARVAASIGHPNIVTVYDLQPALRPQYIVMEHMSRGSLRACLNSAGRLSIPDAVNLVISVCRGLKAAHDRGVVHRDVKPDNILLGEQNIVRLGDFGIAHLPENYGGLNVTWHQPQHPRTPIYASPEQVRGGHIDGRSDLYSVGVVLYELLTGSFYFDREACRDVPAVDRAVLEHIPEPPSLIDPAVPSDLDEVVMRLLQKDPARRYSDAAILIEDLEKFSSVNRAMAGAAEPGITSLVTWLHRERGGVRCRVRLEAENAGDKVALWGGLTMNFPSIASRASVEVADLVVSSSRKGTPLLRAPGDTLWGFRTDGSFGEMTATCLLVESPEGPWQPGERLSLEASMLTPGGEFEVHIRAWATWEGKGKGRVFSQAGQLLTTNGDPDWADERVRDQQGLPAHRLFLSVSPGKQ